jgi:acetyl-CoA acetyltransferase
MLTGADPCDPEGARAQANMSIDDIDLFEVNEAFASVVLAWLKETGADDETFDARSTSTAAPSPWATRWAHRAPS